MPVNQREFSSNHRATGVYVVVHRFSGYEAESSRLAIRNFRVKLIQQQKNRRIKKKLVK
jgi:hypothetical protein